MEKLKLGNRDGVTWYDNEDIGNKVNELVGAFNELKKDVELITDIILKDDDK